MKILCDRNQLQEAFSVVSSVVPPKTTKPILQNVLLRSDEDGMTLFGTDLEMAAKVTLDAVKIDKPGSVLLPAKQTGALLRELSDPTVTLDSKDGRCKLESGGGSFILLGDDPEQFPEEIRVEGGQEVSMPAGRMVRMIQETAFSAAREETRYAINGVLVDMAEGRLRLVATDGRRLALTYENLEDAKAEFKVVVPLRALNALTRAVDEDSSDELSLVVGDKQVEMRLGRVQLISQLLESRFPDYEGVIPKAADTTADLNRALLESSLRKAAIMSGGDVRMVRFELGSSSLQLSAESSDIGRADVTMDAHVKGAGGSINFNPDYVLDALRASDRETVRLDITDESTPAKFILGEAFTYVLMPIGGS